MVINYIILYLLLKLGEIWRLDIWLFNLLGEMDIFKEKGNEVVVFGYIGVFYYDGLLKIDIYC